MQLRAFEIKQGVEAPCPNVGGSCNAHIQQNVQKVAADILNEFTTGLRAQGGAATPEQKRALRDRLISDAGPIRPHEMRKVTHVDLLVVLAVWCGISICARGNCCWGMPYPFGRTLNMSPVLLGGLWQGCAITCTCKHPRPNS